ncbi:transglycosylase SLT domain-containing protein [Thermus thermamylovorans]|uniref:Lytic transglycosylase domain-containing protein n=1 Tax=Thermus thermamylovorans TaxID=2509362 RepID=A0A4Q9AXT2_9DEIN|nr:transglycosylase SLT domain-containing protein [Thermus thermamylovorans]TBH16568.1 lytic transglycosylase domain-containing protein [Thermus thermamylovorans]
MRRAAYLVLLLGAAFACGHVPQDLWAKTWKYARAWGVDPYLVAAVVWVESGYCTQAMGRAGEVGLGQFMPGTWQRVTGAPLEWRSHPDWALWATAKHLRELWEATRDWRLALAAYNAGLGAVRRGAIPASTQRYVERVLSVYRAWRRG